MLVDLRIYKSLVTATSPIEIQLELDCADLEIRDEGGWMVDARDVGVTDLA